MTLEKKRKFITKVQVCTLFYAEDLGIMIFHHFFLSKTWYTKLSNYFISKNDDIGRVMHISGLSAGWYMSLTYLACFTRVQMPMSKICQYISVALNKYQGLDSVSGFNTMYRRTCYSFCLPQESWVHHYHPKWVRISAHLQCSTQTNTWSDMHLKYRIICFTVNNSFFDSICYQYESHY